MTTTTHWKLGDVDLETVPCPLCAGTAFSTLAITDRYDMDVTTVGCHGCGFVLTNPQPTEAALNDFYEHHYRRYYQKTDMPTLEYIREYRKDERAAATTRFLGQQGALKPGLRVLDIGASEGCMLKAIRDAEPGAQAVAVEPNPLFGAFATTHAGCKLYPSVESLAPAGERDFDLIVINHVYEHVKEPVGFLRQLQALLGAGGRIYIDVPDITQYSGLESLHIAHLYHFGPTTLRRAAGLAGYAVDVLEAHQPVMHPRSLRCLLRAGGTPPGAPEPTREGWAQVMEAQRRAGRYHRKRWPLSRRLRHWMQGGRTTPELRRSAP
jgi:SAM-dependent methyltransferase